MIIDLKDAIIKFKDGGSNELELHIGDGNISMVENKEILYTKDRGLLWKTKEGDEQPMDITIDVVWEYLYETIFYYTVVDFIDSTFNGTYHPVTGLNSEGFIVFKHTTEPKYLFKKTDMRWYLSNYAPNQGTETYYSNAFYPSNLAPDGYVIYVEPVLPFYPSWKKVSDDLDANGNVNRFYGENIDPTPYEVLKQLGKASNWESTSADPCEPYCIDLEIFFDRPCGRTEKILIPRFRYETINGDLGSGTLAVSGKANATEPVVTVS